MKRWLSFLLVAVIFCSTCLMTGCGLIDALTSGVPTVYPDAEKYTVGNTEFEGTVDTLDIWWNYGSVTVRTHKENTVKIEESANKELDDNLSLHWHYFNTTDYGNVLNIRYSASGNFDFGDLSKDITVYLPENDGMDIALTVDAASVDVDMSEFDNTLDELSISTNSGRVSAKIDSAAEVRISGQSDDGIPEANREFFFRADGTVYDLGISSSYAKVDVAAKTVRKGDVGSVFSDLIFVTDEAKNLKLKNSRNDIYATVLKFESIDIETYEGDCELVLSGDASFVLSVKEEDRFGYEMTPKNVSLEYEGVTQKDLEYTVGSGENRIEIATAGELRVLPFISSDTE